MKEQAQTPNHIRSKNDKEPKKKHMVIIPAIRAKFFTNKNKNDALAQYEKYYPGYEKEFV